MPRKGQSDQTEELASQGLRRSLDKCDQRKIFPRLAKTLRHYPVRPSGSRFRRLAKRLKLHAAVFLCLGISSIERKALSQSDGFQTLGVNAAVLDQVAGHFLGAQD